MLTWIRTNAADVTDFAYIFTYDDNGNSLERSEDRDGATDQITSYTYDAKGYRLTETNDTNADGAANSVTTLTYNARGDVITQSYDVDADSIVDRIRSYTYDSANKLTL